MFEVGPCQRSWGANHSLRCSLSLKDRKENKHHRTIHVEDSRIKI